MVSKAQLEQEKKREALFNNLSKKIIGKTPWGKFYGLMRMAASYGEGHLKHKVCIGKDGRVLKIYKSKGGKFIGAFLKPAHEQAARDFGRKKYGRAFLDMVGFGSFLDWHDQKHAKCYIFKPNDLVKKEDRHKKGLAGLEKLVHNCGCKALNIKMK